MLGPILILLGLIWPGWIRFKLPALTLRLKAKPVSGALGAFALAIPFSVAICPFCIPALLILLGVAASTSAPLYAMLLLLAFALGRALPILIGAVAIGWLDSMKLIGRFQKPVETAGGIVLILAVLYMLNAFPFFIPLLA